ncbi:unnamed protein product [Cylindrotheca closterium]|uniref:VWFD domain-containing protein n=1 Tax=Cylindrotheca closterium TaxID=2856 RepID=A0AAD2FPV5_9STRA|nr:unnamed protein product [Cylindrotheca closterium]
MKTFSLAIAATLLSGAAATARFDYNTAPNGNKKCALINVIMDESGSMTGDQNFMKTTVLPKLGQTLHSAAYGYDDVFLCSAGFGYGSPHYANNAHYYHLGCTKITAGGHIVDSEVVKWYSAGATEDGWYAMKQGMEDVYAEIEGVNLLNDCGSIDKNMILVTDEDRDCTTYISKPWLKSKIYSNGYILNVVVDICIGHDGINNPWSCRGSSATNADKFGMQITSGGMDANIFKYEPTATFDYVELPMPNKHYDSYVWHDAGTADHYSDLVIDEAGAVWNINSMRCTLPGIAEAFAGVFVIIKAQEISGCTNPAGCDPRPEIGGDPHITTWKNEHYEFHGQCDLVMMKDEDFADGLGLDLHIRTKIVRYWSYIQSVATRIGNDIIESEGTPDAEDEEPHYWSYIQSVAIRIGNDIIEIEGTPDAEDEEPHYWYNYEYQGQAEDLAGFPIIFKKQIAYKRQYIIDLSPKYPGKDITIQLFKEFVRVKLNGSHAVFGNTAGLLGDYKTGKTLARDGVTELHDYTALGDDWQVLPADGNLFHAASPPQFPEKCIEPEDPRGERKRRLSESTVSMEDAEKACASLTDPLAVKDCVYDVLATQDVDMVGAF